MTPMIEVTDLHKRFGDLEALAGVDLTVDGPSLVGLVGRNGSGKTTLLRHLVGLYLPSAGSSRVLGRPCGELGRAELSRIGWVPQEHRFLDWMTVDQHVRYVAAQYEGWSPDCEARLRDELELPGERRVGALSAGEAQKLALVLGLSHRPDLLLLDEPVSALDPIARGRLLAYLLELLGDGERTVIISSHVLRDVEKIVDRVVCLDRGRVTTDAALDTLAERLVEWRVTSRGGPLPARFAEAGVLHQEVDGVQALLTVRRDDASLHRFDERHGVDVEVRPLPLERMFPFLVEGAA